MENNQGMIQENDMFDMRKTGAAISALRRKAGLTQAELAEKLGISYQAVSSWERGATMPDIGKLMDLARALNTTADCILAGNESPQTQEKQARPAREPQEDEPQEHPDKTDILPSSIPKAPKAWSRRYGLADRSCALSGSGNAGSGSAGAGYDR